MGIRFKLFLPLLFGFVGFYVILTQYFTPYYLDHEKTQFTKSQVNLINSISPSITQTLLLSDLAALYDNIDGSFDINADTWLTIIVKDANNKIIYPIETPKTIFEFETINITNPLIYQDEIFGEITVVTNWDKVKRNKDFVANILTKISLSIFALIIALSFFWQTIWVRRPITRLNNAIQNLKDDDYATSLPKSGNDEIGILTNTFDSMRTTIKISKQNLETALNSAQEKEFRNRVILATTPDPIVTIDRVGNINTFNQGAESTFGYTEKYVTGTNLIEMLDDPTSEILIQNISEQSNVQYPITIGVDIELSAINKLGDRFPIEISINKMRLNDKVHFTLVIRDISERKKIERLKNEFISTVSHELRTPLTAMQGSVGLLQNSAKDQLDESNKSLLDIADRNIQRLLLLINDILDISKLESGKMEFVLNNFSVMEFINQAIEINQSYAESHHTKFILTNHIDQNIELYSDHNRLMQVISNLMSNAAKFSPKDIPVEISLATDNTYVRIQVKDHGAGIKKEFQKTLFEKFTQADSSNTRAAGGTGLGLNISQCIMKNLGGEIGFRSEENNGSEFYVTLPISTSKKISA